MSLLLGFALASACAAPPSAAVPDANAYVRHLVGTQRHQEEALSLYTYDVSETREDLDSRGRVVRSRTRAYEVFHVNGKPVRRLVARNGQPLPKGEQEEQDRRARELAEAIRAGRAASEQPGVRLSRILERYDFGLVGREEVSGRCTLVFDFAALPGNFDLERDFLLKKLAGRLWVDEADQAVVRLDLRNTGGARVAFGLGATVSAAAFHGDFVRLDDGVWLPRQWQGSAEGKKLLFLGFRMRETLSFGNYRRFAVKVEERMGP